MKILKLSFFFELRYLFDTGVLFLYSFGIVDDYRAADGETNYFPPCPVVAVCSPPLVRKC